MTKIEGNAPIKNSKGNISGNLQFSQRNNHLIINILFLNKLTLKGRLGTDFINGFLPPNLQNHLVKHVLLFLLSNGNYRLYSPTDGAVHRQAFGPAAGHAPLRPPGLSSQGRPPVSQQSGPRPAAGAGGRHRRRIPPGGHGGRHPPHYPHPQEPPGRLTFTVFFKKRRLRSPLFGFFGNRSLPLTPKVKIIPLCYRIVTPFFRKE